MLAGCAFKGSFLETPRETPAIPPGDTITINPEGGETVAPASMCQARARRFVGTVSVPCDAIARETRP